MIKFDSENHSLSFEEKDGNVLVNGALFQWDLEHIVRQQYHALYEGKSYKLELVSASANEGTFVVKINGTLCTLQMKNPMEQLLERMGISSMSQPQLNDIKAPMPGLVLNIVTAEGSEVEKGDTLLILEAMKMENVLKSPRSGKVAKIHVAKGNSVEKGHVLITFA